MNLENNIVSKLVSGDKSAFESIYHRYSKDLYYYALGFLKNKEIAEDIVQEAFVYLWKNHQNISSEYPILLYLQKIVKNACLNYFRHLDVEKRYSESVEEEIFSLDEKTELLELVSEVRQAINKLPEQCRKIFVLSCVEGLKYGEVAEDMGVSVNTVKSQVKIAYKKIREDINANDVELLSIFILLNINLL